MEHPLRIAEKDIEALGAGGLVEILNALLRLEGQSLGMDQAEIQTTLVRLTAADGGVDARVQNAPAGSNWIPPGLSVWQSKSGADHTPAKLKTEFAKPKVQAALDAGGTYVVFVGDDVNAGRAQDDRRKALTECCDEKGIPREHCKILFAGQIAKWANEFASVAFRFRGEKTAGLILWSDWAALKRYGNAFASDQARSGAMLAYRERLGERGTEFVFLRLEGQPGVGKSRLALETFRDSPLVGLVLYAQSPDRIPASFWPYLQANHTRMVLVVDECSFLEHRDLLERAELCQGRVQLLTIGQRYPSGQQAAVQADTFLLDRLDDAAMKRLLGISYPLLPPEWLDFIVGAATGFVKIAIGLAQQFSIAGQPQPLSELIRSREIRPLLEAMLPDGEDRRAMEVVALLRRVGWEGDFTVEGRAVCEFLNRDWRDTQARIQRIEDELGLIGRQGRYRYVTPHLLAVWLASETWARIGVEEVWAFRSGLPNPLSRASFEERVQDIGSENATGSLVDTLLGPGGLFTDLQALEDRGTSRFFRLLAVARPEAGLNALRRLILGSPREKLSGFVNGRTDTIWTLQTLAWRVDLFEGAAWLMLELADTEDRELQRMGPYASDEWRGMFGLRLGGTAAPMVGRLRLARRALEDDSPGKRLLAINAAGTVFSIHEHRISREPNLGGAPLPPEWRPKNADEAQEAYRESYDLLREALASHDDAVKEAAFKQVLKIARSAVRLGLAQTQLDMLETLSPTTFEDRHSLRAVLDDILAFEAPLLTPEQAGRMAHLKERLAGTGFGDRFRRLFGKRTRGDQVDYRLGIEEQSRLKLEQAAPLVLETIADPALLDPEWAWLFSSEANDAYFFAWALGLADAEIRWWPFIEENAARQGKSLLFSSAYLRGQVEAGRLNREEVLDAWTQEGGAMALPIYDVIWRGELSDADGERLATIIRNGWLDAGHLGRLFFGRAFLRLSAEVAKELLQLSICAGGEASDEVAVALIFERMEADPGEAEALGPLAWTAIEHTGAFWRPGKDTMASHYAQELAKLLAKRDPARAAELVLRLFDTDESPLTGSDGTMEVLSISVGLDPGGVWAKVAERLYPVNSDDNSAQLRSYRLRLALEKWFVALVPSDVILDWAEKHLPDGPLYVAEISEVSGKPMDDLPKGLLMRFGKDERVQRSLYGQFISGSWLGEQSGWLKQKLELARAWSADPDRTVSLWASNLVADLEEMIRQAELQESERGF